GRRFLYEAVVGEKCRLIGKTVTSDEFKKLKDLYLLKIIRDEETISPIRLDDIIQNGDVLIFTGSLESLKCLEQFNNLLIKNDADNSIYTLQSDNAKHVEAVVSHNSTMLHQKIKYSNIHNKYDASIVSVHRKNETIDKNIGEIRLKPGDVLLM